MKKVIKTIEDVLDVNIWEEASRITVNKVAEDVSSRLSGFNIIVVKELPEGGKHFHRKVGPVLHTVDALRVLGMDKDEISEVLGKRHGGYLVSDPMEEAMVEASDAFEYPRKLTTSRLKGNHINVENWVIHPKQFFDMVGYKVYDLKDSDTCYSTVGMNIVKPVTRADDKTLVVMHTPRLVQKNPKDDYNDGQCTMPVEDDPDTYRSIGLAEDAITIYVTPETEIQAQLITGQPNLAFRMSSEYSFSVDIKGYEWVDKDGVWHEVEEPSVTVVKSL